MSRTFFYILFFVIGITLLFPNYIHKNNNNNVYYDSIYTKSVLLVQDDKINESIVLLKEITSHYNKNLNEKRNIININAHYDLGQIYLSRLNDYDSAVFHFNFIFKNLNGIEFYLHYSSSKKNKNIDSSFKSREELRLKALFMLGYIYHNNLGNFSKAQKYYKTFLNQYKNTDLASSVIYELELIEKIIDDFDNINK